MNDQWRIANDLRRQFPGKQVTVLYDPISDVTTVRVDPPGLPPEVYYRAAKEDEYRGALAAAKGEE